jgi:hypothetical protein
MQSFATHEAERVDEVEVREAPHPAKWYILQQSWVDDGGTISKLATEQILDDVDRHWGDAAGTCGSTGPTGPQINNKNLRK